MTAKEKAIILFTIMYGEFENGISHKEAKRCALIAVDEILNIYQIQNAALEFYELRNHWQDVKQELLKL